MKLEFEINQLSFYLFCTFEFYLAQNTMSSNYFFQHDLQKYWTSLPLGWKNKFKEKMQEYIDKNPNSERGDLLEKYLTT